MATEADRPLRILHVVEAALGGVARHLVDLSEAQLLAGHEVEILYAPERMDETARSGFAHLRAMGAVATELSMRREIGAHDLAAARRLRSFLRGRAPCDVIHGHSSKAGALVRLIRPAGDPVRIYTPNALVTMDPLLRPMRRRLFAQIERRLARRADRILLVSEQEMRHAREIGLPADKLRLAPMGVRPAPPSTREAARARLGVPEEEVVVGFVGRLASQKAPEVALEAFARVAKRFPRSRLVMVGYGPALERLRPQAPEGRVEWLGDADAPALMPGFDVLLLTSRFESFGYVLLEAARCGVPLVSTPTGVAEELIGAGEAGRLVPVDDPNAAAAALAEVIADEALRARLGNAARARVLRFGIEEMASANERAYREAIAERARDR